ncbi:DMT family transporter [Candidatus Chloroploca sp. Khr17]|uniref:DMT family transporter n=1 Tax=Candidatus Chloroploca sp. Khr17 TaxID=2496869 RepID=UPI00101E1D17|nr:DMT family transporter [Candidatus Chloroploca sp. Khr17]
MSITWSIETRQRLIVAGLLGLVALLWTIAEILPTMLAPDYSLYQVVWVRYGTHILLMLLALVPRHGLALMRTRRPALQIGRGLLMIGMPASYIASLGHARGLDVVAVFWLTPLLLLAFAALVQHDYAHWSLWVAAFGSFLGAQLILRPGPEVLAAIPYGLAMGLSFSLYVVLTRSLRDEATMTNLFYSALVVFLPLTFFLPAFWMPLTPRDALLMAAVGVVGLGVLWAIDKATDLAPISGLASLFTLQLVIIAVLLPALTGMRPGRLVLAGAGLVVASAVAGWLLPLRFSATPVDQAQVRVPMEGR